MRALLGLFLLTCCGCAMTRPHLVEVSTGTNGMITRKELWLPSYAIWPGSQIIAKERASIGKTLSAGFTDAQQESGGTNVIEALKAIDSILGKIH